LIAADHREDSLGIVAAVDPADAFMDVVAEELESQ
jgi:hypothetical protein